MPTPLPVSLLACLLSFALPTAAAAATTTGRWPAVSGPIDNARLGAGDVALVAGVGRPFVLPPIPGATDVATDWYRFLVEGRGVPVENAVLLRDGDVTKETLLTEAARLRKSLKPGGTFWMVFIGHGAPSTNGTDGLLLGVDVQPTIRSIEDRGLSQRALLQAAGNTRIVAVMDACFSGVGSDGSGQALVPGAQATLPLRRAPSSSSTGSAASSITILQASDTVAGPLPGHDRPAFSYLLLGGVRGWADDDGDGVVHIKDAFAFAKKALTVTVRDRSQVPSLLGSGDVVVHNKARERGPSLGDAVTASSTTTRVVPSRPDNTDDTFDRVAAEDAFKKRRVVATGTGFVRGAYATVVEEASIVKEGARLAPEAAGIVRDISGQAGLATTVGVGVGVAGALGGMVVGGVGLAASTDGNLGMGLVGGFLGGLAGVVPGILVGVFMAPSQADTARLSSARSDLAEAINTAERRQLGLE